MRIKTLSWARSGGRRNDGTLGDESARPTRPPRICQMEVAPNRAPACPPRAMENTDPDGALIVCADRGRRWAAGAESADESVELMVNDMNGNVLSNGDSVVQIEDLVAKGSSTTLKMGAKIRGPVSSAAITRSIARPTWAASCSRRDSSRKRDVAHSPTAHPLVVAVRCTRPHQQTCLPGSIKHGA